MIKLEDFYQRLKSIDPDLPKVTMRLLSGCDDHNCECRQNTPLNLNLFIDSLKSREQASHQLLDDSLRVVLNNPNVRLVAEGVPPNTDKSYISSDCVPENAVAIKTKVLDRCF